MKTTAILVAVTMISLAFVGCHNNNSDSEKKGYMSPPPKAAVQPTGAPGARALSFDAAYDRATRALPGARVMFVCSRRVVMRTPP